LHGLKNSERSHDVRFGGDFVTRISLKKSLKKEE